MSDLPPDDDDEPSIDLDEFEANVRRLLGTDDEVTEADE